MADSISKDKQGMYKVGSRRFKTRQAAENYIKNMKKLAKDRAELQRKRNAAKKRKK